MNDVDDRRRLSDGAGINAKCERQLPDDLIRAVIERDGVIESSMTCMPYPDGNIDWGTDQFPPNRSIFPREAVTLDDSVGHIDDVCQLAGDALHAGIGGDTEGQGGREAADFGIDPVVDYQRIADVLCRRGYKESDIENVMYRNGQRLFERWLPAGLESSTVVPPGRARRCSVETWRCR